MRNSRSLLWLLAGAAVGAAAVYVLTRDDRDEMLDNLTDFARRTKDNIAERLDRLRDMANGEETTGTAETGYGTGANTGYGNEPGYGRGTTM
jgi:hypothetical protein